MKPEAPSEPPLSAPLVAVSPVPTVAGVPAPARPVRVEVPTGLSAAPVPRPGDPGFLFFGAHRRSGTTWLTAMLNAHPRIQMRNEGWLYNDRNGSFDVWLDRKKFNSWAIGREAQGTWLRHIAPDEAARLMQQAMLRTLFREATIREKWKDWDQMLWCGDKTTNFYNLNIESLHDLFPPGPPAHGRFLSMVRDARDTVVSNLFLLFRSNGWADLPADALGHAQAAMDYHVHGRGKPVPLFNEPLMRHMLNEWIRVVGGARRAAELYGPSFLEVRYESLVADTPGELRRIYDWLGVGESVSEEQLLRTVDTCKFENFSNGRKRGEADPLAEWRRGVVGDWMNFFTEDDKRLFKSMAGSLLIELGYERDLDW